MPFTRKQKANLSFFKPNDTSAGGKKAGSKIDYAKLLGIIGAVLGIILVTLNIVSAIQKKHAEASAENQLEINVQYLSIPEGEIQDFSPSVDEEGGMGNFLSYPVISNDILENEAFPRDSSSN